MASVLSKRLRQSEPFLPLRSSSSVYRCCGYSSALYGKQEEVERTKRREQRRYSNLFTCSLRSMGRERALTLLTHFDCSLYLNMLVLQEHIANCSSLWWSVLCSFESGGGDWDHWICAFVFSASVESLLKHFISPELLYLSWYFPYLLHLPNQCSLKWLIQNSKWMDKLVS